MALSRRNLFRKAGSAAVVAAVAPVMRHSDVLALDSPDKAAELADIPSFPVSERHRSPGVCPTCLAPAASIVQLVNHDAYVCRCNRSHTWKVSGLELVEMPRWMYDEWEGAVRMAKVMPPVRETFDEARRLDGRRVVPVWDDGTVDATAYARERGL